MMEILSGLVVEERALLYREIAQLLESETTKMAPANGTGAEA